MKTFNHSIRALLAILLIVVATGAWSCQTAKPAPTPIPPPATPSSVNAFNVTAQKVSYLLPAKATKRGDSMLIEPGKPLTALEARELLAGNKSLTPAQWLALVSFLASVGLAFLLEEQSVSGLDKEAIFTRAEELFASNGNSLSAHIDEYRAAQG